MPKFLIAFYILQLVLLFISIINLSKVDEVLDKNNNNLKEFIDAKEANTQLRYQNLEQEECLNKIDRIINKKGQGTIIERYDKIKEVIQSTKQNNF